MLIYLKSFIITENNLHREVKVMGKLKDKIAKNWDEKVKKRRRIVCDFCGKEMPGYDYVEKIYGHLICKKCMDRIHMEARLASDEEVKRLESKISMYGKLILAAGAILVLILSLYRKVLTDGAGQTTQMVCIIGMGLMFVMILLFVSLLNLSNKRMVDLLNNKE